MRKAGNGFYGSFEEMGLYIFCKDDMSDESVCRTCSYITDLQKGLKTGYDFLFLSETDSLYVCDLRKSGESGHAEIRRYPISQAQRKDFFINAIKNQELRKTAIA